MTQMTKIKSGAYKKDRLNENFLKKVNKDVDVNKTIADYEESKKSNLEFMMRNFLYNVCRKAPQIVEVPYKDHTGKIVKDKDGDIVYRKITVYSYNYNVLCNAVSKIIRQFRPKELYEGQYLRLGLSGKEENEEKKNIIYLYKNPGKEWVAKCSKLTDWDMENMKLNSVFCTNWVMKILMFYMEKRLGFTKEEQKKAANIFLTKEIELSQ